LSSNGFSEDLKRFIIQHIDSVEKLEVILFLFKHADTAWTAAAISEKIRTNPDSIAYRLVDLHRLGLLETSSEDQGTSYRFRPESPNLDALIVALAKAYAERRVSLINLIFSKPIENVKGFAEAFRLRKDE